MRPLLVVPYYVAWHYGKALRGFFSIAGNFVWFIWHFFSIGLLARTWFSPWQRLSEERPRGFDVESFFSTAAINVVMRLVGFAVRTVFIAIGLVCIAVTIALAAAFLAVWIALPLLVALSLIVAARLIFSPA